MHVRTATTNDVEALFDIRTSVQENHESRKELAAQGVTPASVADMLSGADSRAWIADVDGVPAAFSMAIVSRRTIFALFVMPGREGNGLGRALLAAAEAWLLEQGVREISLTTGGKPWLRAHGFYSRCGWTKVDTLSNGDARYAKSAPEAVETNPDFEEGDPRC